MEHQHHRYSTLDWPTHEALKKADRMRGELLRDGIVALVRRLRATVASTTAPRSEEAAPVRVVGQS